MRHHQRPATCTKASEHKNSATGQLLHKWQMMIYTSVACAGAHSRAGLCNGEPMLEPHQEVCCRAVILKKAGQALRADTATAQNAYGLSALSVLSPRANTKGWVWC